MKISELSAKTNVSAHRLRRYEFSGLISSKRLANGYRDYADHTVREVIFIAMSRDMGFSLEMIAEYLPRFRAKTLKSEEMITAIRQRIDEVDEAIAAQQNLRQKLLDHIDWFHSKSRKSV